MAAPVQQNFKPKWKRQPLDKWSTRERLALACSVMRSGDQNWVSVSRAIKSFGEPNRPPDWFSQKNCALQYSDLLEKVETPKRKRGDKGDIVDTPGDLIARKLSNERIDELNKLVGQTQRQFKRLRRQVDQTKSGDCDDRLDGIWDDITACVYNSNPSEFRQTYFVEKRLLAEREATELKRAAEEAARRAEQLAIAKAAAKAAMPLSLKSSPRKAATKLKMHKTMGVASTSVEPSTPDNERSSFEGISTENMETTDDDLMSLTPTIEIPSVLADSDASSCDTPGKPECQEPTSPKLSGLVRGEESEADDEQQSAMDVSQPSTSSPGVSSCHISPPAVVPVTMDETSQGASVTSCASSEVEVKIEPEDPADAESSNAEEVKAESEISHGETVDVEEPSSPISSIGGSAKMTPPRQSKKSLRLKEEDEEADAEDDQSTDDEICQSDDNLSVSTPKYSQSMSFLDSTPNSPASHCSDTDDERTYRLWKKSIMLVWRSAAMHKYATVFSHPVTDDIAAGYSSVVYRPMDLSTVKKNVELGFIKTTAEFQRDIMLMFTNALMYNSTDHDVYKMADNMYDDVMRDIEQFVSTQSTESKPIHRPSRRSDVTSDKEDETKRRRVSADTPDSARKPRRHRPDD